jgi:L-seryl-tRNA(Ser) seleniumtransferase
MENDGVERGERGAPSRPPDGVAATATVAAHARQHQLLRQLPSVDDLLRSDAGLALLARHPRWAVVAAARAELDERRQRRLRGGAPTPHTPDAPSDAAPNSALPPAGLAARVEQLLRPSLRRVINATGVVLHTNLGRAPLAARALLRVQEVARGYSNLEYDTERRGRGSRHEHVAALIAALTGAEAAAVVNNNAAAVLVALAALAAGREAVVSRGELIEIGGGFRIPDVMRAAGVVLKEVGTTNKTRIGDYLSAIGQQTALLLKVHRSNFALVGFTEEAGLPALVELGRPRGIPVMVDLGSGALLEMAELGLPVVEPSVRSVLGAGADLCVFSGDKLLGGPQAGILAGKRAVIDRVLGHPLMRAVRPDKMTLAALEATLEIYREGRALDEIPALRMLGADLQALAARKDRLLAALAAAAPELDARALAGRSAVGGGALPLCEPETWMVGLSSPARGAEALARALAAGEPAVVARVGDDRVLLDVRTLADDEIDETAAAVARAGRTMSP